MSTADDYLTLVDRALTVAMRDVEALLTVVDWTDPVEARDELLEQMPVLVQEWGTTIAQLALEYAEDMIGAPVALVDDVPWEQIAASIRWALSPVFPQDYTEQGPDGAEPITTRPAPDPEAARRNLRGAMGRHVRGPGREQVRDAAERHDGVAWARVLRGEQSCAFCIMLASRGAVYESAATAGARSREVADPRVLLGDRWHSHCDCSVVLVRDDSDYPDGYDVDELYRTYMAGRQDARSQDPKDILAGMRRLNPGMH